MKEEVYHEYVGYTLDDVFRTLLNDGGNLVIPLVKMQQYTLGELFEKQLLFLIPFYIFSHERRFEEYEHDEEKLESLRQEYGRIKSRLEELAEQGEKFHVSDTGY